MFLSIVPSSLEVRSVHVIVTIIMSVRLFKVWLFIEISWFEESPYLPVQKNKADPLFCLYCIDLPFRGHHICPIHGVPCKFGKDFFNIKDVVLIFSKKGLISLRWSRNRAFSLIIESFHEWNWNTTIDDHHTLSCIFIIQSFWYFQDTFYID